MFNVSKFVKDHIPLCACTLGIAVFGYLGYHAVKWIINKCHKTKKIDEIVQRTIGSASPQRALVPPNHIENDFVMTLNNLPRDCLGIIVDYLEGADLRLLKLTCKGMSNPVSKSQRQRIYSNQLALPAISHYGIGRAPGVEIKTLYTSDLDNTKRIVAQLKAEGRLSEINSVYYENNTPLQSAIHQNLEKVKLLVEEGGAKDYLLKSNREPENCMSALVTAARSGNVEVVRYLLSQGAQAEASLHRNGGHTIFVIPTLLDHYCDERIIEEEVRNGNINIRENQFKCLGLILSYTNSLATIRTQTSLSRQCPVEVACIHGRHDLMELLLNFGFEWPALAQEDTRTQLFINAVFKGHLEIVRWFINTYEMNVNLRCNGNITPLHIAKAARREDAVDYLLSCGANPNALTDEGQDYQTYAKLEISLRALEALAHFFSSGAGFQEFASFEECYSCLMDRDINRAIDKEGNTLLHIAAKWPAHESFYGELIPALIRKGADLTAKNTKGQTPYDVGIKTINNFQHATNREIQEMHDRVKQLAI